MIALAAALYPAGAEGKGGGVERLRVCGASGCRTISDPLLLQPMIAGIGPEADRVPSTGPFFTLIADAAGWPKTWPRYLYVPEADLVRQANGPEPGSTTWYSLIWTEGAYERATRGLTPFPRPVSWNALKTPAQEDIRADRLPFAIGGAVAFVLVGTAGIGLIRRRRRPLPD